MTTSNPPPSAASVAGAVRMRSGTAARLAGLPVTTLRVWERRYGVVAAPKQGNGQRLYSESDVQRLRWLRVLTQRGHAIGTIALLDLDALRGLGAGLADADLSPGAAAAPIRAMVVGRGLARRLQAAAGCEVVGVHDDLSAARSDAPPTPVDLLVVQLGSLQPDAAQHVLALGARVQARQIAVLYAFGAAAAADELRAAGVRVLREPVAAADLSRLLVAASSNGAEPLRTASLPERPAGPLHVAPRRFSDDALGALASTPSSIACECLRHVVELVTQLGAFERYSADCVSLGAADAALHRDLSRTAGASRTLFEEALARMMDAHPVTNAPQSAAPSRKG